MHPIIICKYIRTAFFLQARKKKKNHSVSDNSESSNSRNKANPKLDIYSIRKGIFVTFRNTKLIYNNSWIKKTDRQLQAWIYNPILIFIQKRDPSLILNLPSECISLKIKYFYFFRRWTARRLHTCLCPPARLAWQSYQLSVSFIIYVSKCLLAHFPISVHVCQTGRFACFSAC